MTGSTTARPASERSQFDGPREGNVTKVLYKKFRATIEYTVEVTEDYAPSIKDEKQQWASVSKNDPEIIKPKVTVEEL
jgi:BioD-like phosphotransacetylase family protein